MLGRGLAGDDCVVPDAALAAIVRDPITQLTEKMMARYMIERTFPDGLSLPANEQGSKACGEVVAKNMTEGVTWIHSYFTPDRKKSFCVYDGPSPEAIREVAKKNGLPVDRITEVRVLDPYFYR